MQPKKRFFGGSKAGAIACFILGGFFAIEELSRTRGDPTVLILTAVFVLAGIATLMGKRYKCLQCLKSFNLETPIVVPVKGELSRWAVYSLLLSWIPIAGLLMALQALKDTRKRKCVVYGQSLAWISLVISSLFTLLTLFGIIMANVSRK